MGIQVKIGVSNKHIHLCEADIAVLFGAGYRLRPKKGLQLPGEFASEEVVDVAGPKGTLKNVRLVGPAFKESQVELALTDARAIGLSPPVRESGILDDTPGVRLIGPNGKVNLSRGVIAALRHIHISAPQALEAGLKDKDLANVRTFGSRPLIFQNVLVRIGDVSLTEFHVDTDEANAAGLKNGDFAEIIGNDPEPLR